MQSESEYDTSLPPIEDGYYSSMPDLTSSADGFTGDQECFSTAVGGDSNTECTLMLRNQNGRLNSTITTEEGAQFPDSELSNCSYSDSEENYKRPIKRRKQVKLSEECLRLRCEWQNCREAFQDKMNKEIMKSTLLNFVEHVEMHANELVASENDDNEDMYACLWKDCGFETLDKSEAKQHINYHAYHTKLKCIGNNVVIRNDAVDCLNGNSNINGVPESLDPLVCNWDKCNYESQNMQKYLFHVDNHIRYIGRRLYHYKCQWKGCSNSFKNENKLRCHLRVHTKEKLVGCPDCGSMFASNTKLLDHCKRQTPMKLQGYQCSHCRKHYPSERILRDHMRLHINRLKCIYCDMTCANKSTLAAHVRFRHIKFKSFSCRSCNFKCETKQDLVNHLRKHDLKDRFECEEPDCEFTCRSNQTMKIHFLKEHENVDYPYNVYECHVCKKQFTRGTYLTVHLRKKHGLKWPSGHKRFAYRPGEDGKFRLQRIRYESEEVTQLMMANSLVDKNCNSDEDDNKESMNCLGDPQIPEKDIEISIKLNEMSPDSGKLVVVQCEFKSEHSSNSV